MNDEQQLTTEPEQEAQPQTDQPPGGEYDRMDLAWDIAEKYGINPILTRETLNGIGKTMPDKLVAYGRVEIHGLGVFRLEPRAPRDGKTPGPKGKEWSKGDRFEVVFHAAPEFNQIIEAATGVETYSA